MGIGEAIKKGFSTALHSVVLVLVLLGINVAFNLIASPFSLKIQAVMTEIQKLPNPDFKLFLPILPLIILVALANILISAYTQAGLVGYLKDKIKSGPLPLASFFTSGAKYLVKFLLLMLLGLAYSLAVFIAAIAVVAVGALIASLFKGAALASGIIIFIFAAVGLVILGAGIYFGFLFFSMAPYAIVVQESKVMDAVKSSLAFVRSKLGPIIGLTLIFVGIILLLVVFVSVSAVLLRLGAGGVPQTFLMKASQLILTLPFGFLFTFFAVFMTSSFMSYYLGSSNTSNNTSVVN